MEVLLDQWVVKAPLLVHGSKLRCRALDLLTTFGVQQQRGSVARQQRLQEERERRCGPQHRGSAERFQHEPPRAAEARRRKLPVHRGGAVSRGAHWAKYASLNTGSP